MNMKPMTTKQFIWTIIASGLGVTLWLHSGYVDAALPLLLSNFIFMSPEERNAPLEKWTTLGIFFATAAFIGLCIWSSHWLPKDPPKFMVNPAVVLPLWLVFVWFVYRGWRSSKCHGATIVQPTSVA
jgi:hypothetical protein